MLVASAIEKNILATLAWFDINERPLTTFECWYYLFIKEGELISSVTLPDVAESLINLQNQNLIKSQNGFWQLISADWLEGRQQKERWALPKWKRAQQGACLIAKVPFVRMVALVNSVAWASPRQKNSDVDLFIVASANHLWLVRLLVTLLVQLRGWRRHGVKTNARLCLSFYTASNNLAFENLALPFDPYLYYWAVSLVPLYDEGIYKQWQEKNIWVKKYLPNAWEGIENKIITTSKVCSFFKIVMEKIFDFLGGKWLDVVAKKIQWGRLSRYVGEKLQSGSTDVVVSDTMIKMHMNDRRGELAGQFIKKLNSL